jgi:hypothetical protein
MKPRKYKSKPVVIEAMLFDGSDASSQKIIEWAYGHRAVIIREATLFPEDTQLAIPTLEGTMTAQIGDYIIRGTRGEFYPCKPNVFRDKYEELTDET